MNTEYFSSPIQQAGMGGGKIRISFGEFKGIDLTKVILGMDVNDARRIRILNESRFGVSASFNGPNITIGSVTFNIDELKELEKNNKVDEKEELSEYDKQVKNSAELLRQQVQQEKNRQRAIVRERLLEGDRKRRDDDQQKRDVDQQRRDADQQKRDADQQRRDADQQKRDADQQKRDADQQRRADQKRSVVNQILREADEFQQDLERQLREAGKQMPNNIPREDLVVCGSNMSVSACGFSAADGPIEHFPELNGVDFPNMNGMNINRLVAALPENHRINLIKMWNAECNIKSVGYPKSVSIGDYTFMATGQAYYRNKII
jgi:hypothetical protein